MPAVVALTSDYFPPELKQLSATAAGVLRAHVADQGRCTGCGSAWPCERALLAERNLAAL
jgi:hypothetical protein